jgi:hypothetical protein
MKTDLVDRISLKVIGSEKLRKHIVDDIQYILGVAKERSLIPKMLVVGSFFIKFGSVETLITELNIGNWEEAVQKSHTTLNAIISEKLLATYEECEKQNGKFADTALIGIEIYFDPDEYYMSLKCIDPSIKVSNPNELATKDGYQITSLYFQEDEVLDEFLTDEIIIS